MVTSLNRATAVLAEVGPPSHASGHPWWVVGLILLVSCAALGLCLTAMTLADRKRHPHTWK